MGTKPLHKNENMTTILKKEKTKPSLKLDEKYDYSDCSTNSYGNSVINKSRNLERKKSNSYNHSILEKRRSNISRSISNKTNNKHKNLNEKSKDTNTLRKGNGSRQNSRIRTRDSMFRIPSSDRINGALKVKGVKL